MVDGSYSSEVLARLREPRNLGSLPREDPDVGTGEAREEGTGRLVRVQLRVDSVGVVREACFKAFGCPATIASASLVAERASGVPLAALPAVTGEELAQALRLGPERRVAAETALAALQAAIEQLRGRRR